MFNTNPKLKGCLGEGKFCIVQVRGWTGLFLFSDAVIEL